VPTTIRERVSDRLLRTGVELAAERELMTRSLRAAARDQRDYERAAGQLLLAQCVDTLLIWLSARLRRKSLPRYRVESS
jgi:hypothetical protein